MDTAGAFGGDSLDLAACVELLRTRSVGRVGLSTRSLPTIVPVRYVLDGHRLLLRSAAADGAAPDMHGAVVAFETGEVDPATDLGWSVVVQGRATRVPAAARSHGPAPFELSLERVEGHRVSLESPAGTFGPVDGRPTGAAWVDDR